MKNASKSTSSSKRRRPVGEYDFSKGQVGRYAARAVGAVRLVPLDAGLAAAFPDDAAVRAVLRAAARRRKRAAS